MPVAAGGSYQGLVSFSLFFFPTADLRLTRPKSHVSGKRPGSKYSRLCGLLFGLSNIFVCFIYSLFFFFTILSKCKKTLDNPKLVQWAGCDPLVSILVHCLYLALAQSYALLFPFFLFFFFFSISFHFIYIPSMYKLRTISVCSDRPGYKSWLHYQLA